MKPVEVRLVGRFRLEAKIPGEHQHVLYRAIHTQTQAPLFLKGQQIKNKPAPNFLSILQQGKILQTMQGGIGIPHMHWCGQQQDYNFIVLEELGADFTTLLKKCNSKFTLKSVLMFGCEAISMIQYYHFKNFVHNHVNPKHFMIGSGQKYGKLFLVDYSNSIRYRDAQTLEHIAQNIDRKNQMRTINMQFSSIRYQKGQTPSRKDDIISLLYLMLYFLRGQLPWSGIMKAKRSQNERCKAILEMKEKISSQKLFEEYPQMALLYDYTDKLGFDEKPRYTFYKNVFGQKLEKEGQIDDKIYDWYLLEDEEDDQLGIDLNFEVIPNQDKFIKQLSEQIKAREKTDPQNDKQTGANGQIAPGKINKKKNDKDCLIY